MAVTLDGIDIETITDIGETQRSRINSSPLGIHSLQLTQHLKAALHQFEIVCVWSAGATDYTNKKRKLHNISDGGLPVWLKATDWATNQELFGRVSDVNIRLSEGKVDVYDVTFLITSVFPWGYTFVQDDGAGDFRIYDLDRFVQSRTVNPLLRNCSWSRLATTFTYSIYVKNVGGASGACVLEVMIPNSVAVGDVVASAGWTKAVGDVATAGFSASPGSKRRLTLTKTFLAGVEEQLTLTITYSSSKTSYIDGSVDDIAG